jgi:hypothetical protein
MPVETESFPCGHCGKPVLTHWAMGSTRNGLLNGPYALIGDVVFHDTCAAEYLKDVCDAAPNS